MKNADMPAMPNTAGTIEDMTGLSKREHIAAMAMQGLLSNPERHEMTLEDDADVAVLAADTLLIKLERTS